MKVDIYVNILGDWVKLTTTDKIQGTLAYNWLNHGCDCSFQVKDEYIDVIRDNATYTIHKSCIQLVCVKRD